MIGIIPAGGESTRMGGIPKMLLPIPGGTLIDALIQKMERCSLRATTVLSQGIAAHLLNDYNVTSRHTETMSEAVLFVHEATFHSSFAGEDILFGMPDTYFDDDQAFVKLAAALDDGADVAVGLFHVRPSQRHKLGMCAFDPQTQQIIQVIDKSHTTTLAWAWGVLAWKPSFWQHLRAEEPHVGYALPRAIDAGLDVRAVRMEGEYFDCGTPDEYFECIEHLRKGNEVIT